MQEYVDIANRRADEAEQKASIAKQEAIIAKEQNIASIISIYKHMLRSRFF